MSRLLISTPNDAQLTVEGLYRDLERRIIASPPGLCPVDLQKTFLQLCHAQSLRKVCTVQNRPWTAGAINGRCIRRACNYEHTGFNRKDSREY